MSNPSLSLWQSVSDACAKDDALCRGVLKVTDNEWLAAASDWLIAKPFSVLLIVLIAFVARWFLHRTIDRVTSRAAEGLPTPILKHKKSVAQEHTAAVVAGRRVQRAQTMGSLLKSITSGVIFGVVLIMCLAEVRVNVAPILASAGVVGLVVFVILMIINFIVVTKGAERISEVSARFTLDALPGQPVTHFDDLFAADAEARRRAAALAKELTPA